MKYTKKPVTIEAVQWTGDNFQEIFDMQEDREVSKVEGTNELEIKTLEGVHTAKLGDYIIKGIQGELYPCKPDIFNDSYNVASDALVEEQLMSYKVTKDENGEIEVSIKVHQFAEDADGNLYPNGTVNTWSLGTNEEIAKTKVKTIIDTYLQGLEYVQGEVRRVFEEAEEANS